MDTEKEDPTNDNGNQEASTEQVVINAVELFEGRREVCLELDGVRYRLRITRRNKLILQK